jgi:hypothetical protein
MKSRATDPSGPTSAAERKPSALTAATPAVANVLALQRTVGNAAVVRLLQRDDKELKTAEDIMKAYATAYVSPRVYLAVDDEALGRELAGRVVAGKDISLAHQVFDALMTSDRDDVAEELCKHAGGGLAAIETGLKVRLIRELVDTVVAEGAEQQVTKLWLSFGARLGEMIANQKDLWKRSLSECEPLTDHFANDIRAFGADIVGAARAYLGENRRLTQEEGAQVGLNLGGKPEPVPQEKVDKYFDEMRKAAKIVSQLELLSKDLSDVAVGYRMTPELIAEWNQSHPGATDADTYRLVQDPPKDLLAKHGAVVTFDPIEKPTYAATGNDPVEMAPYAEVAGHHQALAAHISTYARVYPTIHAALTQGKLQDLSHTTDASKARQEVEATLKGTLQAITDSEKSLGTGITHYDLVPIQQQLLTNTLQKPATKTRAWETPLYSAHSAGTTSTSRRRANSGSTWGWGWHRRLHSSPRHLPAASARRCSSARASASAPAWPPQAGTSI